MAWYLSRTFLSRVLLSNIHLLIIHYLYEAKSLLTSWAARGTKLPSKCLEDSSVVDEDPSSPSVQR